MKDSYVCMYMKVACEWLDEEIRDIFPEDDSL
jgi:hypothetical protein